MSVLLRPMSYRPVRRIYEKRALFPPVINSAVYIHMRLIHWKLPYFLLKDQDPDLRIPGHTYNVPPQHTHCMV